MTIAPLVPSNECKDTLKTYEELWTKIKDNIRSIANKLDKFNEKCMKVNLTQMMIQL